MRGRIGFLGHDPLLYRDLTARENLRFHARLHGVPLGAGRELLDAVGLRARAATTPCTRSRAGWSQRVAVCRAVLHEPELLLLDEPLADLDPGAAAAGRAADRAAGTRVLISHDVEHGLAEADLVLGLRGGRAALLRARRPSRAADVRGLYA